MLHVFGVQNRHLRFNGGRDEQAIPIGQAVANAQVRCAEEHLLADTGDLMPRVERRNQLPEFRLRIARFAEQVDANLVDHLHADYNARPLNQLLRLSAWRRLGRR